MIGVTFSIGFLLSTLLFQTLTLIMSIEMLSRRKGSLYFRR